MDLQDQRSHLQLLTEHAGHDSFLLFLSSSSNFWRACWALRKPSSQASGSSWSMSVTLIFSADSTKPRSSPSFCLCRKVPSVQVWLGSTGPLALVDMTAKKGLIYFGVLRDLCLCNDCTEHDWKTNHADSSHLLTSQNGSTSPLTSVYPFRSLFCTLSQLFWLIYPLAFLGMFPWPVFRTTQAFVLHPSLS